MTSVLLVAVALGGVCAYVWSAIVQAEGPGSARAAGRPIAPSALTILKNAAVRLLAAPRKRREARIERDLEVGSRRLRFEDTAELTIPGASIRANRGPATRWVDRPSRLLSAVQLVLLIVLVSGAVAAAALGIAQVISRAVASH